MDISYSFSPDDTRARHLDRRMRSQLADSLDYLAHVVGDQLDVHLPGVKEFVDGLKQGAFYPPSAFGLYYEITVALMNSDYQLAMGLFNELTKEQPVTADSLNVVTLDKIAPLSKLSRYQRLMNTDPTAPFYIIAPPANEAEQLIARFNSAYKRIHQYIPALANELDALIREVVLVIGDKQKGYDFVGGSCYLLWGALFINADQHATDIDMIEAMAHESAHSLLFGFTVDELLVENQDEERYPSPLRDDPRPMDGVYHATFVSARMHWAMSKLLESRLLGVEEIEQVIASREADRKNFWSGYETVCASAKMTRTGRKLMESAYNYMNQFQSA